MTREYGKWKYTADEKPDSTRHVIVAFDFSDIAHGSHYQNHTRQVNRNDI